MCFVFYLTLKIVLFSIVNAALSAFWEQFKILYFPFFSASVFVILISTVELIAALITSWWVVESQKFEDPSETLQRTQKEKYRECLCFMVIWYLSSLSLWAECEVNWELFNEQISSSRLSLLLI